MKRWKRRQCGFKREGGEKHKRPVKERGRVFSGGGGTFKTCMKWRLD